MDQNSQFLNNISSQLNFDCSVHIENVVNDDHSVFKKCESRQCGLCCVFNPERSFKSTTTGRTFKTKLSQDKKLVDCRVAKIAPIFVAILAT